MSDASMQKTLMNVIIGSKKSSFRNGGGSRKQAWGGDKDAGKNLL